MLKRAGHAVQTSVLAGQQQHAAAKAGGTYALDVAGGSRVARVQSSTDHGPDALQSYGTPNRTWNPSLVSPLASLLRDRFQIKP